MIERSQRRKTPKAKPDVETLLRLHERLASQRLWFFRLLMGSALALVVSVILWLLRVPLLWHVSGIVLAFIAGLFVRRSMKAWALGWIRARAGLSYETALEQQDPQQQNRDALGFSESLRERASEEASRLTLPRYQAWWLPMLAASLGLAFLPLIPSLTNLPTPLTTQPTTSPPETAAPNANTVEPSQPQQTSQVAAEPPPGSQASSQEGAADTSELNDAAGSSSTASSDAQSADEQALDRFLENLRENEQSQDQAPDVDLSSVMQPSGGSRGQPSDEDRASRPRSEQTNPFSQAGDNQNGETQQNGEAQQGQNQSPQNETAESSEGEEGQENESQQVGEEQEGTETASQNSEGAREGDGEENQGEGQEQQGQEQQGEGQQAQSEGQGEQGQEGAGERGSNAEAQGTQQDSTQQGSDSGQNAQGAGSLPGTPTAQSTEVTGSSKQNPEFLSGQISEGPNNIAGTARLPGETGDTVFPEGNAPSSFSRAEEEALTEGRIPLEYQEVIRNYFRSE